MEKEKAKNVVLALLIATSVILTQQAWFDKPLQMFSSEASYLEESEEILEKAWEQVVRPSQVIVGFGGGAENRHYTVLDSSEMDRFWQEGRAFLRNHFQGEPAVQTVSKERYQEVREGRSLEMIFPEGFPTVLLSQMFDQQENRIVAATRHIRTVLIPARDDGTLYVTGEEDEVYEFRLPEEDGTAETDLESLIDGIPANSYVKYYPLFSYAGNDTLLPLTHQHNQPRVFVETELDAASEDLMNQRAGRFFDEHFDFVKTIQETGGTRIYMYGYGQQEVRINNLGRLEYAAETGSQSSNSVTRSLEAALLFMAEHEGLGSNDLVLREVELLKEGDLRGYSFGFGYDLQGVPVLLSQGDHPVEIEVFGTSIRRYRTFQRQSMNLPEILPEEGIRSPHRLIEDHFNALLEDLQRQRQARDEAPEEAEGQQMEALEGEELLEAIQDIQLVYLDRKETHRRQLLVPVWQITIEKKIYQFDAHEGILLETQPISP